MRSNHPLPFKILKSLQFLFVAGEALLSFPFWLLLHRASNLPARKGFWMQHFAKKFCRVLNLRIWVLGEIPQKGLVVANHLSYLDIIALGSIIPAVFVAKKELRSWPLFGLLAYCAGTIFVDRNKNSRLSREIAAMGRIFRQQVPVILFPEGTSSGGDRVLPFRSSLFCGAKTADHATPVVLEYNLCQGSVPEEVCYWKDMTFLPHLWNLLGKTELFVNIRIGPPRTCLGNRKELALNLHRDVSLLHQKHRPSFPGPGYTPHRPLIEISGKNRSPVTSSSHV